MQTIYRSGQDVGTLEIKLFHFVVFELFISVHSKCASNYAPGQILCVYYWVVYSLWLFLLLFLLKDFGYFIQIF